MEQVHISLMVNRLSTTLVDESRKPASVLPLIFRGMPVELVIRVYGMNGASYPVQELAGKTWRLVISNVWNPAKTPLLESKKISVSGNEIRIVLEDTNTAELATVISTAEAVTLGAELYGIPAGMDKPDMILEFSILVHNRRGGTGVPTHVPEDVITASQVAALLSAGLEVQFSTDRGIWEMLVPSRAQDYRWYRLRNPVLPEAQWSDAVPLIVGPTGAAGTVAVGSVTKGEDASVVNSGTAQNAVLDFILPKGDQGRSASVRVGNVSTGDPGTPVQVVNSGSDQAAVLDFSIPRGADGTVEFDRLTDDQKLSLKGEKGDAATIRVGAVATLEETEPAVVVNAGTTGDAILDFSIPRGVQGLKGDKGDKGDRGNPGPPCSLKVGTVTVTENGTVPTASITGKAPDQIIDFSFPKGVKGDKGDGATIAVGTVATGQAGTRAEVTNSGSPFSAVFNFKIPKGDKGDATFLYVAWARDSLGSGFSLTPSDDRKYRAELLTNHQIEKPSEKDFASCAWVRNSGSDGASYGAVAVTDNNTVVPEVKKITFQNATVEIGPDGEAIVTFSGADGSGGDELFSQLILLRSSLSSHRAGGGSPGGDVGVIAPQNGFIQEQLQTDSSQSTWEA